MGYNGSQRAADAGRVSTEFRIVFKQSQFVAIGGPVILFRIVPFSLLNKRCRFTSAQCLATDAGIFLPTRYRTSLPKRDIWLTNHLALRICLAQQGGSG
jgi:hypothetical protein